MKIIRLTTLLDFGGQEKQYISFTDEPDKLKNEYIFASIGHGGYAEKLLKERGFEVKVFNLNVKHSNLKNIFIISRWLRAEKPDIVHTAASEANFHGILAAKLAGIPVIIGEEIGVPNTHSKVARLLFKIVYKFANKVIAVSQLVSKTLVEIKEVPVDKLEVIYNPVSKPRSYEKIDGEKFQWVFCARLMPRKNTKTLIKAFSKLDTLKRGVLHIVGDGVERENLTNLVNRLNLSSDIIFHGFQSEPERIVSQADVFVLPAFDEGFGISVIEAMFQKKPCLCGRGGGIPEYLVEGFNGWFFDPSSEQDLTSKMNIILQQSKSEICKIGNNAYESTINKFTVEHYIENIEKFYLDTYRK